jgi:hypothetical protein
MSVGCSGTPGQDGPDVTAARLAELQTGMPNGNPPAWYTEKLAELGYTVMTLRYERSDLLAYDVVKDSTAFQIKVALDPETATASQIEIQPVAGAVAASGESSGPAEEPAPDVAPQSQAPSVTDEPRDSEPPAAAQPEESARQEPAPETPPATRTEPQPAETRPEPQPAETPAEPEPVETPAQPQPVVALPAGTFIPTLLNDRLDSGVAQVGDRFSMMVKEPVSLAGVEVLPAGSRIWGYVAEVQKARRPNSPGRLTLKADLIEANGAAVEFDGLVTAEGERLEGEDSIREDIKEIAVGAGVGGLVGGLLGGGKGVIAGILIGGGGTFVATKGEEVRIPPDTALYVELREEVIVPVAR